MIIRDSSKEKNVLSKKGFTLVETIIYVALIGMVVSTFVSFGLKVTEIRNKNYVVEEVQSNARSVLDFLAETIKQSSSVVVPFSANVSNSLELDLENESDNLIISVTNGALSAILGSNPEQFINSRETNITNLEFSNFGLSGERDSIKINLTIEFRDNDSNDFTFSQNLETSVSLRL